MQAELFCRDTALEVLRDSLGYSAGAALALLVQGLTAWHLLRTAARILPGETVVVNAAAGGVGHLAIHLAKEFGAGRAIGTASTPDKRALVLRLGADAAIPGEADGYAERIREANGGALADVILDAVGGPVFEMVGAEYPLDQAATALTALTTRRTTGKVILRMV